MLNFSVSSCVLLMFLRECNDFSIGKCFFFVFFIDILTRNTFKQAFKGLFSKNKFLIF